MNKSIDLTPDLKIKFAQSLRRIREANGLTASQVAEMVGISQPTYSKYESLKGDVMPSLSIFVRLGETLGVPLDALVKEEAPAGRPPSKWVADLLPALESLDRSGREAVIALVRGLKKES
jgi:transcriptional regulator with XRE-family HTH domain